MRILVTGSRAWDDEAVIENAIADAILASDVKDNSEVVIVHGACPTGADDIADSLAVTGDIPVERHPANWESFGKAAGFMRNAEMVALGADVCLAFIKDNSRGATHTANLAESAGIRTVRYTA